MKELVAVFACLVCSPCFSQEFVVDLTEEELTALEDLDDANKTYATRILTGKRIETLKGSSPVGSVGFLNAFTKPKTNRDGGSREVDDQTKAGLVIDKVIDGENAIVNGYRWWLEGFDTKTWKDGGAPDLSLRYAMVVKMESKSYVADNGRTKNLQHYVNVDLEPADELIDFILDDRGLRLFTNSTGKRQFIGKFLHEKNGTVSIESTNGKIIRDPLSNFSVQDQRWIKNQ